MFFPFAAWHFKYTFRCLLIDGTGYFQGDFGLGFYFGLQVMDWALA